MNEKVEIFKDKTNFSSNEFLHINSCGATNDTAFTRVYRPLGRVDFFLCLVKRAVLQRF